MNRKQEPLGGEIPFGIIPAKLFVKNPLLRGMLIVEKKPLFIFAKNIFGMVLAKQPRGRGCLLCLRGGYLSNPMQANDLATRLRDHLRATGLFPEPGLALLAVSGGPDSVAMLDLMVRVAPEFELRLAVVHVDHGIADES